MDLANAFPSSQALTPGVASALIPKRLRPVGSVFGLRTASPPGDGAINPPFNAFNNERISRSGDSRNSCTYCCIFSAVRSISPTACANSFSSAGTSGISAFFPSASAFFRASILFFTQSGILPTFGIPAGIFIPPPLFFTPSEILLPASEAIAIISLIDNCRGLTAISVAFARITSSIFTPNSPSDKLLPVRSAFLTN